jgi:hypothetical protein
MRGAGEPLFSLILTRSCERIGRRDNPLARTGRCGFPENRAPRGYANRMEIYGNVLSRNTKNIRRASFREGFSPSSSAVVERGQAARKALILLLFENDRVAGGAVGVMFRQHLIQKRTGTTVKGRISIASLEQKVIQRLHRITGKIRKVSAEHG